MRMLVIFATTLIVLSGRFAIAQQGAPVPKEKASSSYRMPTSHTPTLPQPTDPTALVHVGKRAPLDQHPAAVYLARLAPGSRRTMSDALDKIAGMLTADRCDRRTLRWDQVRYQHTQAVRSKLADQYEPATTNKMISALRAC